jgi:threonine dehydrogenase-like Zn-dependent dehydrogenase
VVNGVRGSAIQVGDDVCLIGCGYMGLLLLQALPKEYIHHLLAFDIQEERLKLATQFGAGEVFDPTDIDPIQDIKQILGKGADVVIEASGAPETMNFAADLLRPGGRLVVFGRHVVNQLILTEEWHVKGLTVVNTAPNFSLDFTKDFQDAVFLLKKGVFDQKPLITHQFSFRVPETAFQTAATKPLDYIKGVITFNS